jgi:urease accessory protein
MAELRVELERTAAGALAAVASRAATATDELPAARATPSVAGWQARLRLRFAAADGRTRMLRCEHSGPLLVQRLFYPEAPAQAPAQAPAPAVTVLGTGRKRTAADPCHAYLIHPPGGLVSGDQLELEVEVEARAHVLLTTPAAAKFYRRRGARVARTEQLLRVDRGVLEWLPQETIYYPETSAAVRTIVRLEKEARFIGWEIGCLGWPAVGASLGDGSVRQTLELWLDEQPLWLERLCLGHESLAARWGLAHHAAVGTWLAYPARAAQLEAARAVTVRLNCPAMMLACTIVDGVLCCRGLAQRADHLKQAFIDLWRTLRPSLLGREAVAPRIWAT